MHFNSSAEVENATTQFMSNLNVEDLVRQTDKLLEHCKHVVEHNGSYVDCGKLNIGPGWQNALSLSENPLSSVFSVGDAD